MQAPHAAHQARNRRQSSLAPEYRGEGRSVEDRAKRPQREEQPRIESPLRLRAQHEQAEHDAGSRRPGEDCAGGWLLQQQQHHGRPGQANGAVMPAAQQVQHPFAGEHEAARCHQRRRGAESLVAGISVGPPAGDDEMQDHEPAQPGTDIIRRQQQQQQVRRIEHRHLGVVDERSDPAKLDGHHSGNSPVSCQERTRNCLAGRMCARYPE